MAQARLKDWGALAERARKNQLALIWESEYGKDHRTFSYFAMNREVTRMANIIKFMGVTKGDLNAVRGRTDLPLSQSLVADR